MKRVNAAPPVVKVYVVGPTLALSFAGPASHRAPRHIHGQRHALTGRQRGHAMASATPGPVCAKLALPLPARKVFCPAAEPVTVLIPAHLVRPTGGEPAHRRRCGRQVDRHPRHPGRRRREVGRVAAPGRIERVSRPSHRTQRSCSLRPDRRTPGSPQRARSPPPAGPCPSSPPARRCTAPCSTPTCTPAATRPGQTHSSAYPHQDPAHGSCPHPSPHRRSCRHCSVWPR